MAADSDRYFRGRPGLNLLRYDCKFTLPEAALGSLRATSEGMGWEQNKEVRRGGGGRAEPFAGASPANVEDETDGAFYFLGRKFIPGDTFGFETEASLRILPIQPDQFGTAASFFRGCPSGFDRYEVLERGEQKRAKSSLRPVNGG